jgi:hypothetical protein
MGSDLLGVFEHRLLARGIRKITAVLPDGDCPCDRTARQCDQAFLPCQPSPGSRSVGWCPNAVRR